MHDPRESPVLVLGSGQRCGSTLVQRLLGSHPEIMVWGEQGGHLRELLGMQHALAGWDIEHAAAARMAYAEAGVHGWIANLLPGPDALREAARAYLLAYFHAPAATQGKPRWGFKEVRFGLEEARALRDLFGGLTAVHVTRDPRDVLRSLDVWERGGGWRRRYTEVALASWVAVNKSFLASAPEDWVLSVRYEDLVGDPEPFVNALATLLGIDPTGLDRSVFERQVRGYGAAQRAGPRSWSQLPPDLRALLDPPEIRRVAAAYGYDLG